MTTGAEMYPLDDTLRHLSEAEHLTESQMDDALIGDLAAEAAGHLAACGACQQQLAVVRMPLDSFKAVTLAWSERRSATMPVSLNERAMVSAAAMRRRTWGSAIAALLAVMVAVPYGMRQQSNSQNVAVAAPVETAQLETAHVVGATGVVSDQVQAGEANAEQIASDNRMLSEIDRELESNTASSAAMELQDVQAQATRPVAGQAVQD